ncbi:MAG: preprotein translocase subunit SecE [Planctomycetota bacterium]|jgi:preprotein translocase SecE subunit
MLYRYKPDEGRNARQTAFWLGEGMVFFGCYALSGALVSIESLRGPLIDSMPEIPMLGMRLTGAVVVSILAFLAGSYLYLRYLAKDRIADHLIEVEAEMRKVTWPTFEEATNSSIVVVITVLVLMAFLAVADYALGGIFDMVLWGGVRGS